MRDLRVRHRAQSSSAGQTAQSFEYLPDPSFARIRIRQPDLPGNPTEDRAKIRDDAGGAPLHQRFLNFPLVESPPVAILLLDLFVKRHVSILSVQLQPA